MHIKFLDIIIDNFMSIGHGEVKLDNQGYVLVSGVNNNKDDLAKSNGSGKSALFESVIWCLTGETMRGTRQIVNSFADDGAAVQLTFKIDSDTIKICRYKETKEFGTNLKIYINNQDKSGKGIRDTEKLLEQYLPDLTLSLIGSVIILGQGLPQRFSNNTPAGRKEVLEKLSKSDFMIEDIKNKLTKRKDTLNQNLRQVEDTLLSNRAKVSMLEKQLQNLKDTKALLTPIDFDSEIKKYQEQLDIVIADNAAYETNANNLRSDISKKLDEYSLMLSAMNDKLNSEKTKLTEELLNPFYKDLDTIRLDIDSSEKEIRRLKNIKDICPTCGQKIPGIHKVDTTDLEKHLSELYNTKAELDAKISNQEAFVVKSCNQLKESLEKDLQAVKNEGQQLRENLTGLETKISSYKTGINNLTLTIDKIKLNKADYENKSKTIDQDINNVENELKSFADKILYNNNERDDIKEHLDIVSKMLTIASRDFRGFLLSEVISYINNKAKSYCQDIFETDKLDFTLDGNNINITYNGKQYENLSGGEKQKVDLIIQFSIRDMLSQFLNFSSNILVCDEIFDNCDSLSCQKIIDMISRKLTDVDSIFIITHHENELSIPYDLQLTVVKNNYGISEIII